MSLRPRFLSALVAIFAFSGAATQIASCAFEPYGTQAPDQARACATDANCDDQNPCTSDQCQPDKTCVHSNAANAPLTEQIAGDCRREDCIDGEVVPTNDDADIADDNEPCTTDGCGNGNPSHMPVEDGTMCTMGTSPGNCVIGVCTVECSPTKPCDDNNPCTKDSCNAGVGTCTFSPLDGLPTPGFQEPVGDCKLHICANGIDAPINDDADVPDDLNSCTQNVCVAGMGSNPGVSTGTPCVVGQPEVCDGDGACVQCNAAADCVLLPVDTDCRKRTCINHACGQTFTAVGTPTMTKPGQVLGDCKRIVCDGTGGTQSETFDTDVPIDNNSCSKNICTNGLPSNPLEDKDFVCGVDQVCNAVGECVGCNVAAQCVGTDDFCKTRTCTNQICGYSFTAAGTDLPGGQTSQNCQVIECDGLGAIVENPDGTDKPVDGNQCTQDLCVLGIPLNPFEMVNVTCSQSGGTVCNGAGACKKANSAVCAGAADCLSGFCVDGVCCNATCGSTCKSCNVPGSVGTCVNVPKASEDLPGCTGTNSCDGSGVCKKDDAQGCSGATECVSNFCIDGVCCASSCNAACRVCNAMGSVGVCTNITSGEDNIPVGICANTMSCDSSGACKLKDSQSCTTGSQCISGQCFDGVCCNASCSGTCKSCNIVGAVGICSNLAAGQDDANGVPACSGANQSCDGTGVCKKENAQTCTASTDCLSGFCVDGVCCNGGCTATCQACNLTGSIGACTNVANGQDDVGTCSGATQSCDGVGACKSELGTACSIGANCLSNFCVDGYCCNTACTGNCQACSALVAGQGTNGTCGPILSGNDPDNECTSGSCNGVSTCKLDLGIACTTNIQCLSNFCADGVCCNSACGSSDATDCQACSVATGAMTDGTCTPLVSGTTCRASGGICDVAETCNGSATACPVNTFVAVGTSCRATAGLCDVAETCTGSSATCPVDGFSTSGTVCRGTAGVCDVAETCSGLSAACPIDAFSSAATVCRMAAGLCDVAETCTGMAAVCPTDTLSPSGTTCRMAAGLCDVAETCTGMAAACPTDALTPSGTTCRMAAGLCDAVETCSGISAACPMDAFSPMGTTCRIAATVCDVTETCSGMTASCPTDTFVAMGIQCAAPSCMGTSQVNADTCNGTGACVDNGTTACQTGYTCVTNACITSCGGDSDCAADYFCSANMCVPLSGNGATCTASSHCANNHCVDGICCDTSCTDTCMACNVAGSLGTCSDIVAGQDDTNATMTCSGTTQSCDGAGNCKSEIGEMCAMGTDCLNGNCIDNFCCDTTCMGECMACNVAGSLGICSNIPLGVDDDFPMGICSGAEQSCDGNGVCKLEDGATCPMGEDANCFSTVCSDGVCCNNACSGICEACTAVKKGSGSDGTCGVNAPGTDPDNECTAACDGMGMCQP